MPQPLHYHGEIFGERRVYNDRLLMFMLRNRSPDRFGSGLRQTAGASGENAVDKMERKRLRKRWRREWEAERDAELAKDASQVSETINTKLDTMRENWLKGMSPHVRALHRAWQQAEIDEREGRNPPSLPLLPGVPWPSTEPRELEEAEWEELDELEEKGITPR